MPSNFIKDKPTARMRVIPGDDEIVFEFQGMELDEKGSGFVALHYQDAHVMLSMMFDALREAWPATTPLPAQRFDA